MSLIGCSRSLSMSVDTWESAYQWGCFGVETSMLSISHCESWEIGEGLAQVPCQILSSWPMTQSAWKVVLLCSRLTRPGPWVELPHLVCVGALNP